MNQKLKQSHQNEKVFLIDYVFINNTSWLIFKTLLSKVNSTLICFKWSNKLSLGLLEASGPLYHQNHSKTLDLFLEY